MSDSTTPPRAELKFAFTINGEEAVVSPTVIIASKDDAEGALDYLVGVFTEMTQNDDCRQAVEEHFVPQEGKVWKKGEPPPKDKPLRVYTGFRKTSENGMVYHAESKHSRAVAACNRSWTLVGSPESAASLINGVNVCGKEPCMGTYYAEAKV